MSFILAYKISTVEPLWRHNPVSIRVEHISLYKFRDEESVEVELSNGTWCIVLMSLEEFEKIIK